MFLWSAKPQIMHMHRASATPVTNLLRNGKYSEKVEQMATSGNAFQMFKVTHMPKAELNHNFAVLPEIGSNLALFDQFSLPQRLMSATDLEDFDPYHE